ncbi:hypothetical protein [Mycobacterium sp. MMS18-G62]
MRLFGHSGGVRVEVSPAVVSPRQPVQAAFTVEKPVTKVSGAVAEWGYTNFYRYRWAGRADAAAAVGNDSLLTLDQVGTDYGSERDTDDWVAVTRIELSTAGDEFAGGAATFTVPSWAAASSPLTAQWSCRLMIQRSGRDIDARGDFTVWVGPHDVEVDEAPMERTAGTGETDIDIAIPTPLCCAGQTVNGHITLTPRSDLPDGDVAVYWQRQRDSHPLTRSPAAPAVLDGRPVHLAKGIALRAGSPVVLPFALELPADAAPTASMVHSSLSWFIGARMFYKGFSSHLPERVRRPIVVVNALTRQG